jgi:hypothetical protein
MQGQHELHNKKETTAAHQEEHELKVKEHELKVMGEGEKDHVQDVDVSKCQEPGS